MTGKSNALKKSDLQSKKVVPLVLLKTEEIKPLKTITTMETQVLTNYITSAKQVDQQNDSD